MAQNRPPPMQPLPANYQNLTPVERYQALLRCQAQAQLAAEQQHGRQSIQSHQALPKHQTQAAALQIRDGPILQENIPQQQQRSATAQIHRDVAQRIYAHMAAQVRLREGPDLSPRMVELLRIEAVNRTKVAMRQFEAERVQHGPPPQQPIPNAQKNKFLELVTNIYLQLAAHAYERHGLSLPPHIVEMLKNEAIRKARLLSQVLSVQQSSEQHT